MVLDDLDTKQAGSGVSDVYRIRHRCSDDCMLFVSFIALVSSRKYLSVELHICM